MSDFCELSDSQIRAIAALASGQNQSETALAAGVSPRTIYRWLREEEFLNALQIERQKILDSVVLRLTEASLTSVKTLLEISQDRNAEPSARVSASRTILSFAFQGSDDLNRAIAIVQKFGFGVIDLQSKN